MGSTNKALRSNASKQLQEAAKNGDVASLRAALAAGADPLFPTRDLIIPLCWAAINGHVACLKILTPVSTPYNLAAFFLAAAEGHVACIAALLPFVDPKHDDCRALRMAAGKGNAACVELLIPMSEPKMANSWALRLAATNGHVECVRQLLPFSDADAARKSLMANDGYGEAIALLDAVVQEAFLKSRQGEVGGEGSAADLGRRRSATM